MKKITVIFLLALLLLASCFPEDRSGEQPFAPTVKTVEAILSGDSLLLVGEIVDSHNSKVLARGFNYGDDTLRLEVASLDTVGSVFRAYTRPLRPGIYFVSAYARNGVGTTNADTMYVEIFPTSTEQ